MIEAAVGAVAGVSYVWAGCMTGVRVYDTRPTRECRGPFHIEGCRYYGRSGTGPTPLEVACACHREDGHSRRCPCAFPSALAGIVWPFVLPLLVVSRRMHRPERDRMVSRRRTQEAERELGIEGDR